MGGMFRAFRSRNYRLFFGGQSISLIGTWMQQVAMQVLVYKLTRSTYLLGVISVVSQVPAFLISPLAGVWLDMWDRRKLLVTTQTLAGVQALILAILVFANVVQVWHLIALSVFLGLVGAFDMPGRQSFLMEIVHDREDIGNAIALNSSQFNVARLVGPALAGFMIKFTGEKMCFLLNAVSYVAVVVALILMIVPKRTRKVRETDILDDLKEGFRYTSRFKTLRDLLILLAATSFSYGMFAVLLPQLAIDFFHGTAMTLSLMYIATGIGAVAGAVMLANRRTAAGLGTWVFRSAILFSLGTAIFGAVPRNGFLIAIALMVGVGFGSMVQMASTNTLLQTLVEERMRGRVMSFYTMSFIGPMPLGSFLGGTLVSALHVQGVCIAAGLVSVVPSIWFYLQLPELRAQARPILLEKGAIPAEKASAPAQGQ